MPYCETAIVATLAPVTTLIAATQPCTGTIVTAGQRPNVLLLAHYDLPLFCWPDKNGLLEAKCCDKCALQHYGCPANLDNCPFKMGPGLSLWQANPPEL